ETESTKRRGVDQGLGVSATDLTYCSDFVAVDNPRNREIRGAVLRCDRRALLDLGPSIHHFIHAGSVEEVVRICDLRGAHLVQLLLQFRWDAEVQCSKVIVQLWDLG